MRVPLIPIPLPSFVSSLVRSRVLPLVFASSVSAVASASFTAFVGAQSAGAWFAAAPGHEGLTFTGFDEGTQITNQYALQGILLGFPGAGGNATQSNPFMYAQDGWGIVGNGSISADFAAPMHAFAMYYPGDARFTFYSGTTQLHFAQFQNSGSNKFVGFTSDIAFDRVVISANAPSNFGIFADNMYFSAVPTPASAALLVLSAMFTSRRRRA